jgi:hypothetical protein
MFQLRTFIQKQFENKRIKLFYVQVAWITTLTPTLCETVTWWGWLTFMEPPTMSGYNLS